MNLVLRKVNPNDHKDVEILTREAFWNVYMPEFQGKGIGGKLILDTLQKATKLGYSIHMEGIPMEDEASKLFEEKKKEVREGQLKM